MTKLYIYISILFILICSLVGVSFAQFWQVSQVLKQSGFSSIFQNADGVFVFDCKSECLVVIWEMRSKSLLTLQGQLQGQGSIGYGFLVGQQVIPWEFVEVGATLKKDWIFKNSPYFSHLLADTQIVLIVQGQVSTENLTVKIGNLTLGKRLVQMREDFKSYEGLTVYSINLRYGQKLLGTSVVVYAYWISGIGLVILVLRRKAKLQNVLLLFGAVFLILTVRNTVDYVHIVRDEARGMQEQSFPVLGDMYDFVKGVREKLGLDNPSVLQTPSPRSGVSPLSGGTSMESSI